MCVSCSNHTGNVITKLVIYLLLLSINSLKKLEICNNSSRQKELAFIIYLQYAISPNYK